MSSHSIRLPPKGSFSNSNLGKVQTGSSLNQGAKERGFNEEGKIKKVSQDVKLKANQHLELDTASMLDEGNEFGLREVSPNEDNLGSVEDINALELSEMFEYAQIALKKTSEVQEDISKLFKVWEANESTPECLEMVNRLLQENGMKSLGSAPKVQKILKVVINLLAEVKVLRESLADRRKDCVQREFIASLQDEIEDLRQKLRDCHEFSFQDHEFDREVLNRIKDALQVDQEEILEKIESFKNIVKVVPSLDIFVQQVCRELAPDIVKDDHDNQSFAIALKEVFPRVKMMKKTVEELTEFKVKVLQSLNLKVCDSDEVALEKVQSVAFFEKLFEVDASEDIFDVIEKLFLYYKETKSLMERLKIKMKLKQGLNGFLLIDELRRLV